MTLLLSAYRPAERERRPAALPRLRALLVVAYHQPSIGHELMRGNLQIVRSRLVLEDAPRQVECRSMARTEKSGIGAQLRILVRPKRTTGRTAQMRADPDRDKELGLDRAGRRVLEHVGGRRKGAALG